FRRVLFRSRRLDLHSALRTRITSPALIAAHRTGRRPRRTGRPATVPAMRLLSLLLGALILAACVDDVDPDEADVEIEGAVADSALAPDATLQPDEGLAPEATLQPDEGLAPAESLQGPPPRPGRY